MLFGKKKGDPVEEAKNKARKAFDDVLALEKVADAPRAARARMAIRAKSNIDLTFIEGAKKAESFEEAKMAALVAGSGLGELDEPELDDPFKLIKSEKGTVVSYIPLEQAKKVFDIGAAYQKSSIDEQQAINGAQGVMDKICEDLGIGEEIAVLSFLRDDDEESSDPEAED